MTDTAVFDELRPLMFAIAYRMTGSVNDAEDIVQEAYLRLERTRRDGGAVACEKAWLSAVTTRLAIDHMRAARRTREQYVGPWLPEPLVTDPARGPAEHAELGDSLSQAFLVVLETLSPVERAVFLLREVFGYDYPEIAAAVGKSEANCRQIAVRARRHVDARRPRFPAGQRRHRELLERFLAACERGEVEHLKELLAADAVLYSDGGGKALAARRPIYGADRVARFMVGVTRKRREAGGLREQRLSINGRPGRVLVQPDQGIWGVLTIDVAEDVIQTVRIMRNPDKLRHLERWERGPGS